MHPWVTDSDRLASIYLVISFSVNSQMNTGVAWAITFNFNWSETHLKLSKINLLAPKFYI
jgi:hypothetical protein